ncbi:NHL domain-containing thioredoxin family protein [Auritidibacter ignavus]|uniref:NHL domain-containing thioredoxin family protein n=1 Tax=Auritidibacter ignavus TaxID=678932 RepID=UPI00244C1356|nr:NHL domain-containing thioredoxin family protein [Auritidibacter ignavus]WGH85334.1 NHL domain-containing thioredoxin family protein [Auritidibacter ignavus]WGH87621.1 NHL domain-containing thioredoxin family protein [Auritidibacter ignavus]
MADSFSQTPDHPETSASASGSTPAPAPRIRASELMGETWFNTGGEPLDVASLRGKIVLLDFWSFCCINCLHVLDELRPLEEKFSDVLVTVGVHSPKFDYEGETSAVAAAIERYEINHPVVNDPALHTWQAYSARAWPTLVVVDPEGYIVGHLSGEGQVNGLFSLVEELVDIHDAKGTLHRGDGPFVAPAPAARQLRFPGKATALGTRGSQPGSFLVSDSGHHRLVELAGDLTTVLAVYGGNGSGDPLPLNATDRDLMGQRGDADGDAATALFSEPGGTTLLPAELAARVGYDVVVADTVNHRLRSLNLTTGEVGTLAGNGIQRLIDSERAKQPSDHVQLGALSTDATETSLSSPWDVLWVDELNTVLIAMAGTHQIFSFDPDTAVLGLFAGTGLEGLTDGPAGTAWFAQSSGLATGRAGTVWVADSESSALRELHVSDPDQISVSSPIGLGLFDFGYRDGAPGQARLQHPLGVAGLPDGSVLIADTYNHAVRRYAPEHTNPDGTTAEATVATVARNLHEPSDVLVEYNAQGQAVSIVVVETNTHQLVRIAVPEQYLSVDEGAMTTQRPTTRIAAGELELTVGFTAPAGQKLDDRWGDPTQLTISSSPEELLVEGTGSQTGLQRQVQINPDITSGVLHITARAAACDGQPGEPIPDAAACHLYQQDWGIPVEVASTEKAGQNDATPVHRRLDLDLRGIH